MNLAAARLTVLVGAAALAAAGTGAAGRTARTVLQGAVTLKAFDVTKACKWQNTRAALRVGCTVYGAYAGLPRPARAGYGWIWRIPADARGVTAGYGIERGTLLFDFGESGSLTLSLSGKQKPVGKQTASRAKVVTTGTWEITKGTASFAGKHGMGSYVFTVARTGSPTVFSLASLRLTGTIDTAPAPA